MGQILHQRNEEDDKRDPGEVEIEIILQRILNEKDPTLHRTAIWELFRLSGDWELFEKLAQHGGQKGIMAYFQTVLERLDEVTESSGLESQEERESLRELYAAPVVCLRQGDWTGSAAAMHEILLNEIYEVYGIDEDNLPFGEATAFSLREIAGEEVLFPLSMIEYLAYSDCLADQIQAELLENHLLFLLTLFLKAQAHLDLQEDQGRLEIYPEDGN